MSTYADNDAPKDPPNSERFIFKLCLSIGLVLLGGVFAGLTLALMGSDDLNLRVLSQSSEDPAQRKAANRVLKLLNRGRHWVLVVLLLGNVIVNESLPIFLDDILGGGIAAVVVSTTMIVIFGEIIPQAVCVRYGLAIGGACAPLVLGLMWLFAPIAYPIAMLLDYVLGRDEGHTYKKAELKSFLQFHREGQEPLRDDEIAILNGVLSLNDKRVNEIMTPIADCLILPADQVLDHDAIDQILLSGFSRIPVHEKGQKDNFIGMLLVKRLITYNPHDEWPVSKFPLLPLPEAKPDINCFQALDYFQTGRAHLLLVSETPGHRGGALGIVSLEDLIEEIIGEEIIDETDRYQDNHSKKTAQRRVTGAIMRGIIERHRIVNALSRRGSRSNSRTPTRNVTSSVKDSDGILVHLSNENDLIAEPVTIAHEESSLVAVGNGGPATAAGQRLALPSASDSEALSGGSSRVSPVAEEAETFILNVDETNAHVAPDGATYAAVAAASSGKSGDGAEESRDLLGEPDFEPVDDDAGGLAVPARPTRRRAPRPEPFPTRASFERAARRFAAKWAAQCGPRARVYAGWTWSEIGRGGYKAAMLTRQTTRDIPPAWPDGTQCASPDPATDDLDDLGDDEDNDDDDDDDAAAAAPLIRRPARTRIDATVSWSPTFRVPHLFLRAFDGAGAPLPLDALVRALARAQHAPGKENPKQKNKEKEKEKDKEKEKEKDKEKEKEKEKVKEQLQQRTDAVMIPGEPFPLLALDEGPTGEMGWSVHPCHVREAVDEVLDAEDGEARDEDEGGDGDTDGEAGADADEGEDARVERETDRGVRWIEAWFAVSDSVIDLSA
ncbi:hypothetical protein Q5752_002092 [Cryptotrichosporon argae]